MGFIKIQFSIKDTIYNSLTKEAENRGATLAEFLRAVVLPEWIAHAKPVEQAEAKQN